LASFWVWRAKKIETEIEINKSTESKITTKLFFFGFGGSMGETGKIGVCGSILLFYSLGLIFANNFFEMLS